MVDRYDEELFLEYVEGELPVEKRVAFENQMLQDPRLRNLVAQMVLDRHRMRTLPDEAAPEHLMDAVNERLERSMLLGASPQEFTQTKAPASNGFRWRRFATMGAMAAMVAMVAGVFIVTLVQLANDTPIRSVGPGSLFPPGILPPALQPTRPTKPQDTASVNQSDPAGTGKSPDIALRPPKTPENTTGQTPDVTTGGKAVTPANQNTQTPQAQTDPSSEGSVPALPAAQVVFAVTTSDIEAAHRRLSLWVKAYDAKVLDTRKATAVTMEKATALPTAQSPATISSEVPADDSPAATAANQSITLDVPQGDEASHSGHAVAAAVTPGLVVLLSLPEEQVLGLEMFLSTLPDVKLRRTDIKPKADSSNKDNSASNISPTGSTIKVPDVATDGSTDEVADAQPWVLRQRQNVPAEATAPASADALWLNEFLPVWLTHPQHASPQMPVDDGQSTPEVAPEPAGPSVVRVEFLAQ